MRLSPRNRANGMDCPDSIPTAVEAAARLAARGVAYLHTNEPGDDSPEATAVRQQLRAAFPGPIIVAGGYTRERADAVLAAGEADLVAFGQAFIANPDLPARLLHGWPLNPPDARTFFGGDAQGNAHGYTDYPTHATTGEQPA